MAVGTPAPITRPAEDVLAPLLRNALHGLGAFVVPVLVALVTTPYIVGRLGAEVFGLYVVAVSLVGFGGLLDLGMGTAVVRFVAEARSRGDQQELSQVINATLLSRLPIVAILIPPGLVLAPTLARDLLLVPPVLQADATFVIRMGLLSLGINLIGGTLAVLPRAAHRFDLSSRLAVVFSLLLTGATVAVLAGGGGVRGIASCELALTTIQFAVAVRVARHVFPAWAPSLRVETDLIRRLLVFGGFVSLNTFAGIVFINMNRLIVGRSLGMAAVTYFSVPWNLSTRINQTVASLTEAITPAAAALSADEGRLRELCATAARLSAALAGSLGLSLSLAGPDFLALWMGREFAERSGRLLSILALSAAIQALTTVPYFVLNGLGRARAANLPVAFAALLSLGLTAALIQRHALEGIGMALFVAMGTQVVLLVWALQRAMPGTGRPVATSFLAVAAACVGAILTTHWLVSATALSAGLRLIILPLSGLMILHGLLLVGGYYQRPERDFLARLIDLRVRRMTPGAPR